MAQHPNLPDSGFPTSTIFTLGTENGIALIRVHTEANDLHLFVAFIRRNDFTVRLHWTNWEPGEEETVINHNGIDVPVDSKEPILSTSIRHQHYYHRGPPFHFQPPTETESSGHPPIYTMGSETLEEHSSLNPTTSTTRLYPGSKQNQKKKMTTATLLANTLMLDYSTGKSSSPLLKQKTQNLKVELKKEILKLVVKDFVAMDNKWKRNSGRFKTQTLAIYFRKPNKDTALYLLQIHPQLYFMMTNLLKGRGLTLPNPSQAQVGTLLT